MDYFSGVVIASLIWVYRVMYSIVLITSQMERNLNKMGQRLSWATLRPTRLDKSDLNRPWWSSMARFTLIHGIELPFVFLSWLIVLITGGMYGYQISKDAGAPQAIREFRWKLRNVDLSLDDLVRHSMQIAGQPESMFDEIRAAMMDDLRDRGLRQIGQLTKAMST